MRYVLKNYVAYLNQNSYFLYGHLCDPSRGDPSKKASIIEGANAAGLSRLPLAYSLLRKAAFFSSKSPSSGEQN